jgi:ABC-type uncharacterized transport system substrate-binding protein
LLKRQKQRNRRRQKSQLFSRADPAKLGIVNTLAHPGGNLTGATFMSVEIRPKMLDLVRELVPSAKKVAVLGNPNRPDAKRLLEEVLGSAAAKNLEAQQYYASTAEDIDKAFSQMRAAKPDCLIVLSDPVYFNHREQVARLALSNRLPSIVSGRGHVMAGALASYGASVVNAYKDAGMYIARILNGEKPENLPVLEATKFELVINAQTATALGINLNPELVARADEVVE